MVDLNKYSVLFFESISLFMALFFLLQYFILQKKEHLFYSLYLFAVTLYYPLAMPDIFFGGSLDDEKFITRFDLFKRPIQFLVSLCYTFFIVYYLDLRHHSYKLFRLFRFLNIMYAALALTCLLLNFLGINYNTPYFLISMMLFPLQIYVLIKLFNQKIKYAVYIICGSIILVLGSSLALINSVWVIKHVVNKSQANTDSYLPVQLAILIDIFLFTVALQKKIADNEQEMLNTNFLRQQAVLLERERIIADLHDDVGGGLSSIRMMSDLMAHQNSADAPVNSSSFPQKISATAKEIAQRMHTIIWSLNSENDTLQNFSEYVRQYGISYFEDSPTRFECNHLSAHQEIQLSGVQRKNLFLIMKESFHNILKHAHAGKATVNIVLNDRALIIEVGDNGRGLTNENKFGNGLKNMKKRMDEIGGDLQISSVHGTTIKVFLNLG